MKFITDENLGIQVPQYLRSLGFDIISVIETALGTPDTNILKTNNKQLPT